MMNGIKMTNMYICYVLLLKIPNTTRNLGRYVLYEYLLLNYYFRRPVTKLGVVMSFWRGRSSQPTCFPFHKVLYFHSGVWTAAECGNLGDYVTPRL